MPAAEGPGPRADARAPDLPSVALVLVLLRGIHLASLARPRPPLDGARVLRVGRTGGFILPVIIERYFGDLLLFYGVTRRCAEIMLPGDSSEWHMRNEPRKDGRDCSVGPAISQRWSCLC